MVCLPSTPRPATRRPSTITFTAFAPRVAEHESGNRKTNGYLNDDHKPGRRARVVSKAAFGVQLMCVARLLQTSRLFEILQ